jgi:hypothetical protein
MPTETKIDAELMPREDALDALRRNNMMERLINALEEGEDIGHYGRFTFASIARHFMKPLDLAEFLAHDEDEALDEAKSLVHQVIDADYSPARAGEDPGVGQPAAVPDPRRQPDFGRRQRLPGPRLPR